VKYIWRASWNWSRVLYLLTRYIPFAPIAMQIRSELLPHHLVYLPHISPLLDINLCDPPWRGRSSHPCVVQSTFTNSSHSLDRFSPDPTPESCERTLEALSCAYLLFHNVTATPLSTTFSDCSAFILYNFQGSQLWVWTWRKVCGTNGTADRTIETRSDSVLVLK